MLYITQLIYLKPQQEKVFDEFEAVAIPLIAEHGGELMLRIRPTAAAFIAHTIEQPYEIHVVSFPTETAFETFLKDDRRLQFLHLKEAAIRTAILIKGERM